MSGQEDLPAWEDADVQIVYEMLCDDALNTPPNLEEHWEGWISRNIVAALRSRTGPAATPPSVESIRRELRAGSDHDSYSWLEIRSALQRIAARSITAPPDTYMSQKQIKHMVDRFLGWKLPENFSPDAGISFKATFNEHTAHPMKHEPSGTNLFDAAQTAAMVRYILEGLPAPVSRPEPAATPAPDVKLTYIKRWRTIVPLPAKYADEIAEALRPEPAAAPPSGWMVERPADQTFPRLFRTKAEADALMKHCNVSPLPTLIPLYSHSRPTQLPQK